MEREICFFLDLSTFKSVAYFAYNGKSTDVRYSEDYEKIVVEGADFSLITDVGNIVPECKDGAFEVRIDELLDRGCNYKVDTIVIPYEDDSDPEELINSVIDHIVTLVEQKCKEMQRDLEAGLVVISYMERNEIPS